MNIYILYVYVCMYVCMYVMYIQECTYIHTCRQTDRQTDRHRQLCLYLSFLRASNRFLRSGLYSHGP